MRFGVHVSMAGGFVKAVRTARALGCESFQIFAGNPRGWARKPLAPREAEEFRAAVAEAELGPVVVHLSYLPNPASLDDDLYVRSVAAMKEDFARANLLGAAFFVVHPGSCPAERRQEGLARLLRAVEETLAEVPGPTRLLLENQASRGRELAVDLHEFAEILVALGGHERVGICFDTCHAFVAGYDLRQEEGWREVLAILAAGVGLERLALIHANDAKGDLGSGLDRHEHIGQGFLGPEAFAVMGRLKELAGLPVILETPQDSPEADATNLARIRALAAEKK
ncbi:MAG: deoxyribonuclease IV [Bacillota bacterium]